MASRTLRKSRIASRSNYLNLVLRLYCLKIAKAKLLESVALSFFCDILAQKFHRLGRKNGFYFFGSKS